MRLLLRWLISTIILLIVSHYVHGFEVESLKAAVIAALVIGLINATIGAILKFITLPLRILSLGLFSLLINAALLKLATMFVAGFHIQGFLPALIAAFWLALLNMLARWLFLSE
jgi:putative membrane protein